MEKTNHFYSEDSLIGPAGKIGLPGEFTQVDKAIIRCLKQMASRRGTDCQALIRKWVRERLEIEMRRLPF